MTSHRTVPLRRSFTAISLWVLALPFLFGCVPQVPQAEVAPEPAAQAADQPTIQVWFTDPENTRTGEEPLEVILSSINSAQDSIDLAIYNLTDPRVAQALIRALKNGVRVRIVMESDNLGKENPRRLAAAGIPIRGDGQGSLMHNKFMIVDGEVLLTGSANFTENGLGSDNNFLVRVEDPRLSGVYLDEFNSMFEDGKFGAADLQPTSITSYDVDGSILEVFFSPEDAVQQRLLTLAGEADSSIHFLAYTFTLDELGQLLVDKHRAGVEVGGVFEGEMLPGSTGTEYDRFRRAGMDIRLDGNPNLMHEKLMIIDGEILVVGSYNFTRAANERNDENLLVIRDATVARRFEQEYIRVFDAAQP